MARGVMILPSLVSSGQPVEWRCAVPISFLSPYRNHCRDGLSTRPPPPYKRRQAPPAAPA